MKRELSWELASVVWNNKKDIKKRGQEGWNLILEYAKSSEYTFKNDKNSKILKIQSHIFTEGNFAKI